MAGQGSSQEDRAVLALLTHGCQQQQSLHHGDRCPAVCSGGPRHLSSSCGRHWPTWPWHQHLGPPLACSTILGSTDPTVLAARCVGHALANLWADPHDTRRLNSRVPCAMELAAVIVWLLGVVWGLLRRLLPARLLAAGRPAVAALRWALQITTPAGIAGTLRLGQEMANRHEGALLRCTCWHGMARHGMAWRKEAHRLLGIAPLPLTSVTSHTTVPPSTTMQGAPDAGAVCHAGGSRAARGATAAPAQRAASARGRLPAVGAGWPANRQPAQVNARAGLFCLCGRLLSKMLQPNSALQ